MSELYYPGFEISTLNWLKYSLLYKKELYTIIPDNVENIYMSDVYNFVQNETDLLKKYNSMYEEGEKTSRQVIELLENILRHPERYFSVTKTLSSDRLMNKWTGIRNHTIFRQKYSCSFEDFILDNNLGIDSDEGKKEII